MAVVLAWNAKSGKRRRMSENAPAPSYVSWREKQSTDVHETKHYYIFLYFCTSVIGEEKIQ